MTLSVVIPTLNEERDLPATLESLGFADEILIVDSGSTDKTLDVAKRFKTKVISHPFTDYSSQRNFADRVAKGDWILSIDADVRVPPKLAIEIKNKISQKTSEIAAYYIGRQNEIWGRVISYSGWGSRDDAHIRLYKKGSGLWVSGVHEQYETNLPKSRLKNTLYHLNYRTVSEFIDKTDKYSDLALNNHPVPFWYPKYEFLKRYFYKLGFLDGLRGLFLSYLQSIYYFNLYIKQKTK